MPAKSFFVACIRLQPFLQPFYLVAIAWGGPSPVSFTLGDPLLWEGRAISGVDSDALVCKLHTSLATLGIGTVGQNALP